MQKMKLMNDKIKYTNIRKINQKKRILKNLRESKNQGQKSTNSNKQ